MTIEVFLLFAGRNHGALGFLREDWIAAVPSKRWASTGLGKRTESFVLWSTSEILWKQKKKPFFCFRIIMKFFCKYMKILHNNHRQKKIRIHRREGIEAMGLSSVLWPRKRLSYRYSCDTWRGQRMLFGVHATERNLSLQHVSGIWNVMLFLNKSYSWKGVWQQSSCHGLWKGIRSLRFYLKASSPFAKI